MTVIRPVSCAVAYGGHVSNGARTLIERLRFLIHHHCTGPYAEDSVYIGLVLRVDGKDQKKPPAQSGVKLSPLKNNLIGATLYLRESDWDIPLAQFRASLWLTTEKAIWTCAQRLKRSHARFDEPLLKQHLSAVASEFLAHPREEFSIS